MSGFGILKENPNVDTSQGDTARFPDAGWLDGPLVMNRLEQLHQLRELRLARRPLRRAIARLRIDGHRVVEVSTAVSCGEARVDEALGELYVDAEAPFCADGELRVVLHPPGRRRIDRFARRDLPVPWPDRVEGPELVDRDCAARDLPTTGSGGATELELEVDRFFVRRVRVVTSSGDPLFDEEARALFRRAELRSPGAPGLRSARVRA